MSVSPLGSNWILRQNVLAMRNVTNFLRFIDSPANHVEMLFDFRETTWFTQRWATLINSHNYTQDGENTQKTIRRDYDALSVDKRESSRETHATVGKQFLSALCGEIFTRFSSDFPLFLVTKTQRVCDLKNFLISFSFLRLFHCILPSLNELAINTLNKSKIILSSFIFPREIE